MNRNNDFDNEDSLDHSDRQSKDNNILGGLLDYASDSD